MLVDALKSKLLDAMRAKKETEKDILRVSLSEIETAEVRQGGITEEQRYSILRKIISNNEQVIQVSPDNKTRCKLLDENTILTSFLPIQLSKQQVRELLEGIVGNLKERPNDGLAIKFAIDALKLTCKPFNSKDVAELVIEIRKSV
jgi:uncharacterized protein YqeY